LVKKEVKKEDRDKAFKEAVESLGTAITQMNSGIILVKQLGKSALDMNKEAVALLETLRNGIKQVSYAKGFYDGRRYIVRTAEALLEQQYGSNRDTLIKAGKLPYFWLNTLAKCLKDPATLNQTWKKDEESE